LSTAAVYHDLGFVERYGDNEPVAVRIARECLPEFNYSPQQVDIVARIILATRIPHRPQTLMEQIMCDADLDYLGRTDFFEISRTLQQEWMAYGLISSEDEWNEKQILFFRQHQYFTATAIEKRQQLKNRHLQEIIQCMKNK
jgi:predicted metal-dependent HD superfamily phosphohydrolase